MPDALKPRHFQILLALSGGALHGAAIMEEVLERTGGGMKLWPATLYGSLRELEERGWITEAPPAADAPNEGGKRRFHRLSDSGRSILRAELHRLEAILAVARERQLLDEEGVRG